MYPTYTVKEQSKTVFVILYKTTHYDNNLSITYEKYTPTALCESSYHLDKTFEKLLKRYLYVKFYVAEVPINEIWEHKLEQYIIMEP